MRFKCPECGKLMTEPSQYIPAQCQHCGFTSALFAAKLPGPIMQDHVEEQFEALARDVKSGAAFSGPEWRVDPVIEQPGDGFRAALLVGIDLIKRAWWTSPFHYWGQPGLIWAQSDHPATVMPQSWTDFFDAYDANAPTYPHGLIRAPFGGMIESIIRRRRRCVICGKFFLRKGWWNPLCGVNIFEEHCSKACADDDLDSLPY